MAKKKLLITDRLDQSGLTPLKKYFQIEKRIGLSYDQLVEIIADYDCILTRSKTGISRKMIDKADELKIIGRAGIGVDNIDIFAATAKKIAVINAPCGNAKVTAEHTIGLIFALLRYIPQAVSDMKKGIWGKQKYIGKQIAGRTLGIVGFGNVGQEVAKLAKGVGLKVIVCEPYVKIPPNISKVTFEELLKTSDIITLHVPLTYLTSNMINRVTLSLCKKGVYLVNCSRGAVVEEKAVKKALVSGRLAGYAADVFTKEPPIDRELIKLSNVIATPHIAGSTVESQKQSVAEVVTGICQYIEGKVPNNLLNPQVFEKKIVRKKKDGFDFKAVIFDCDSTLSSIEGIDMLAELVGKKKQIAQLTQLAMEGKLPFEDVFERRLKLVKPTRKQLLTLGQMYVDNLVEDAKGVIEALNFLGKHVYIVSGGLTTALFQLGETLGLSRGNIFGNDLLFDDKGDFKTFIEGPLRRNHGKLQIIRQISGRKVVIGDGVTDLETNECIDFFVGYGGVARRQKVEDGSHIYLFCRSLTPFLIIAAGWQGCRKLLPTKYKKYVGKGLDLLFHSQHVKISRSISAKLRQFKQLASY